MPQGGVFEQKKSANVQCRSRALFSAGPGQDRRYVSLIGIVTGAFDIGYIRSALIVPGDAAATAHHPGRAARPVRALLRCGRLYQFCAPALQSRLSPYLLLPCLPGEGSLALWLTIMGLNVNKWRAWTTDPRSAPWPP